MHQLIFIKYCPKSFSFQRLALAIIFAILFYSRGIGQDAHFSQYYSSALYLNPSMAGVEPYQSFSSNFRQQWRSIVIPYITSQFSIIQPFHAKIDSKDRHLGGVGFSFYNDRAGEGNFKTIGFNVNAAYNLYLVENKLQSLTFGVQGGLIQKRIDMSNLQWGEQFNPYLGGGFDPTVKVDPDNMSANVGRVYPDIGAGVLYYYNSNKVYKKRPISGFVGYSAYHLNRPNESFTNDFVSRLSLLHKAHAGIEFRVADKIDISPNVLYMNQFGRQHLNSGIYVSYHLSENKKQISPTYLTAGSWYRLKDSFILSFGLGNENYSFGFSYDFNTSNLRYDTNGRGAYEISFSVRKLKETKYRRFHTPRI